MLGRELGADLEQPLLRHAELDELALGLELRLGEMTAHRLRDVLDLGRARAELDGGIAVLVLRAHGDDLAVVDPQHGHRDVASVLGEDAGHTQLLGDETGPHDPSLRA
jgi:hypothetical protein